MKKEKEIRKKDKVKKQGTVKLVKSLSSTTKSLSIKAKLLILLLASVCITLFLNLCILLPDVGKTLENSSKSNMVNLATSYGSNINNSVQIVNNSLNTVNKYPAITEYLTLKKDFSLTMATEYLIDYKMDNQNILDVSIIDSNGIIAISTTKDSVGTDVSGESYIASILGGADSAQSDINDAGTDNQNIVFAIPYSSNQDKRMGVLTATFKSSVIADTLSSLNITGINNLNVCLVDSKGIIISNTQKDLIGTTTKNSVISDVVKQLKSSKIPASSVKSLTDNSEEKYTSYYVSPLNKWTLAFTVQASEIFKPVSHMQNKEFLFSIVILLILGVIGYLFSSNLSKPIKQTTELILKISELDFREDKSYDKLIARKDENGEMCRAIVKMRTSIHEILKKIDTSSELMAQKANDLNLASIQVNDYASDNSATAEELAASMQETSATTEVIHNNIEQVNISAEQINREVSDGAKLTKELKQRAEQIEINTIETTKKTKEIYSNVKEKTAIAIEQAKSTEKINLLTNTIMAITDQTSLLALNASIEAARAGDAGKGFAVVANEISHLAEQSAVTVKNITSIVSEIKVAVTHMSECLYTTLEFLESAVLTDYSNFIDVSKKYNNDALTINSSMTEIHKTAENLSETMNSIVESVSNINVTMSDSAVGVNDIAARNTEIVSLTLQTHTMVKESLEFTNELKTIVELFKL